ncbi:hypothetical protein ACOSQ2_006328 [Xanthoceras sorbifolium]
MEDREILEDEFENIVGKVKLGENEKDVRNYYKDDKVWKETEEMVVKEELKRVMVFSENVLQKHINNKG